MNKRIKKLAEQAEIYAGELIDEGADYDQYPRYYTEKFAELIVRECMTTILKESKWYWDKDEFESSNAIQNAARRVKEHFGVGGPKGWVCSKCGIDRTKAACPKGHTAALTGECPMIGVTE